MMNTNPNFSEEPLAYIGQRMEMRTKIQWILDQQKWTQSDLAERLDVTQPSVNRWLAGTDPRGSTRDRINALYTELTTGSPLPTRQVPLKGYIGAGGEVEALDFGASETVDAPAEAHPDTVAGEVRGLSMLPAYEEGTVIYWSRILPPDAMVNRRCVAQLGDGRIMVKVLKRGADASLWTLVSINPAYPDIEDVPVEWVAKIDWTRPL